MEADVYEVKEPGLSPIETVEMLKSWIDHRTKDYRPDQLDSLTLGVSYHDLMTIINCVETANEALKTIVKHQELIAGRMASMSATATIAKKALSKVKGE